MKRLAFFLSLGLVLASCGCSAPPPPSPTLTLLPTPVPAATATPWTPPTPKPPAATPSSPAEEVVVDAWVDNPTPPQNSLIVLRGSLIKNGLIYLSGIPMRATWPEKSGASLCQVLVTYGRGICTIDVKDYPPGVFVPITITFYYQDRWYTGHTGFTPQ